MTSTDDLHMANVITGIRILCGLILLFLPGFSKWFYVFYLTGGLSDALDGWTARRLSEVSDFGARLDTVANIVFFGAVLIIITCIMATAASIQELCLILKGKSV